MDENDGGEDDGDGDDDEEKVTVFNDDDNCESDDDDCCLVMCTAMHVQSGFAEESLSPSPYTCRSCQQPQKQLLVRIILDRERPLICQQGNACGVKIQNLLDTT